MKTKPKALDGTHSISSEVALPPSKSDKTSIREPFTENVKTHFEQNQRRFSKSSVLSRQIFQEQEYQSQKLYISQKNLNQFNNNFLCNDFGTQGNQEAQMMISRVSDGSERDLHPWLVFTNQESQLEGEIKRNIESNMPSVFEEVSEVEHLEPSEDQIKWQKSISKQTKQVEQQLMNLMEAEQHTFREVNLKACKGKNTNFPKYALRLIEEHFDSAVQEVLAGENESEADFIMRKVHRLKYSNASRNVSLLSSFFKKQRKFQEGTVQASARIMSRKLMNYILRNQSIEEIIKNKRVTCKKTLLVASKVYALRCRNTHLTQRLESA